MERGELITRFGISVRENGLLAVFGRTVSFDIRSPEIYRVPATTITENCRRTRAICPIRSVYGLPSFSSLKRSEREYKFLIEIVKYSQRP